LPMAIARRTRRCVRAEKASAFSASPTAIARRRRRRARPICNVRRDASPIKAAAVPRLFARWPRANASSAAAQPIAEPRVCRFAFAATARNASTLRRARRPRRSARTANALRVATIPIVRAPHRGARAASAEHDGRRRNLPSSASQRAVHLGFRTARALGRRARAALK
jgi:hypothetical protein